MSRLQEKKLAYFLLHRKRQTSESENQRKSEDNLYEDFESEPEAEEENIDIDLSKESWRLRDRKVLTKTFTGAIECKQKKYWKNAINFKISFLTENET